MQVCAWGASLKGLNKPNINLNQDAWIRFANSKMAMIALADGVGSKKYSHIGSRSAVLAAKDTCITAQQLTQVSPDHFLNLLSATWLCRLGELNQQECATTCILAAYYQNQLLLAQTGDGLCLWQEHNSIGWLEPDTQDFGNLVQGVLGSSSPLTWTWRRIVAPKFPLMIVLATDGISADIPQSAYPEILAIYAKEERLKSPQARTSSLKKALKDFNYHNGDDKTMAFLHLSEASQT